MYICLGIYSLNRGRQKGLGSIVILKIYLGISQVKFAGRSDNTAQIIGSYSLSVQCTMYIYLSNVYIFISKCYICWIYVYQCQKQNKNLACTRKYNVICFFHYHIHYSMPLNLINYIQGVPKRTPFLRMFRKVWTKIFKTLNSKLVARKIKLRTSLISGMYFYQ